jgi:hypothetical protein
MLQICLPVSVGLDEPMRSVGDRSCCWLSGSAGNGQLHSQLWSDDSLAGLFFCLNHDPSVKVRRAAMQLMQLVTLPQHSGQF